VPGFGSAVTTSQISTAAIMIKAKAGEIDDRSIIRQELLWIALLDLT